MEKFWNSKSFVNLEGYILSACMMRIQLVGKGDNDFIH